MLQSYLVLEIVPTTFPQTDATAKHGQDGCKVDLIANIVLPCENLTINESLANFPTDGNIFGYPFCLGLDTSFLLSPTLSKFRFKK